MTAPDKPFVALACLCEQALHESDGVTSLIRVVDTFHLPKMPDKPLTTPDGKPIQPPIRFTVAIGLKSGGMKGEFKVALRLRVPSGSVKALGPEDGFPVVFTGAEDEGATFILVLRYNVTELGMHWVEVLWEEGDVLTKIPFRLVVAEESSTPSS